MSTRPPSSADRPTRSAYDRVSAGHSSSVDTLLLKLLRAGVQLQSDGSSLHFRAPDDGIPPSLKDQAVEAKSDLLARLQTGVRYVIASPIQRRLWFAQQFHNASGAYNVPSLFRLEGTLDGQRLRRCFQILLDRHEPLRTQYTTLEDDVVQLIQPTPTPRLPVVDLRALPDDKRATAIAQITKAFSRRRFDLTKENPMDLQLIRVDDDDHILAVNVHHIATDGWSVNILQAELLRLYRAPNAPDASVLDSLPIPYSGYAVWQRLRLDAKGRDAQRVYWQEKLNSVEALELVADRVPSYAAQTEAKTHAFQLSGVAHDRLREVLRGTQSTPFIVLLTAYALLIRQFTGQNDFVVGVPSAGRDRVELEPLIGCFVAMLPIRVQIQAHDTFRDVVQRVRTTFAEAQQNTDIPVEEIIEAIDLVRPPHQHPLFQTSFDHREGPGRALRLEAEYDSPASSSSPAASAPDDASASAASSRLAADVLTSGSDPSSLSVRPVDSETTEHQFELSLNTRKTSNGELKGVFTYAAGRFEAATIERMARQYVNLVHALLEHPDQTVRRIVTVAPDEEATLSTWERGAEQRPDEPTLASVHEGVERWATNRPDGVAVVGQSGAHVTYEVLSKRSDWKATLLRDYGVGIGTHVALVMSRSIHMIETELAVLKAGGTCVPIAPGTPPSRMASILNDAACPVVITEDERSFVLSNNGLSEGQGRQVLRLQTLNDLSSAQSPASDAPRSDTPIWKGEREQQAVPPSAGAYLRYTSGSTGRAKGVVVTHEAIVNRMAGVDYVDLDEEDVVAQVANPAFDAAAFEIWAPLLAGGRIQVLGEDELFSPGRLARRLRETGITTLFVTTALFNEIVRERPAAFASLESVLFGGEEVSPSWVRAVLNASPPERLLHMYGPTETTTFSTWHPVSAVENEARTVPIGKPLVGGRVYVLDDAMKRVPAGVTGEIYIGGAGLSRGYWQRPLLTASRFVPDPFASEDGTMGARMYRTGDLAQWRDGAIEFCGRVDRQVKIRGYRIEPGEVERCLLDHTDVHDATVNVFGTESHDRRLVAHVVPTPSYTPGASTMNAIRDFVADRLPSYLVPAAIVCVDRIPLNANGKIDPDSLPTPDFQSETEPADPIGDLEATLAEVWTGVLGLEVGRHDDFFELGGHSLLAMQITSRIQDRLRVDIPVRALFDAPTIAELARYVESRSQHVSDISRSAAKDEEHPSPTHEASEGGRAIVDENEYVDGAL